MICDFGIKSVTWPSFLQDFIGDANLLRKTRIGRCDHLDRRPVENAYCGRRGEHWCVTGKPSKYVLRFQNHLESSCIISFLAGNHTLSAQLRLSFDIDGICDFGTESFNWPRPNSVRIPRIVSWCDHFEMFCIWFTFVLTGDCLKFASRSQNKFTS